MPESPERVGRVRSLVASEPGLEGAPVGRADDLGRLCRALVRAVPASGAGMTVSSGGESVVVVAAAGTHAEEVEELQLMLGEGPSVDAVRLRRPVLEPDVLGSGARRWPAYAPAANALEVCGVFAFPLQLGATLLGVLDVYQSEPGPLSRGQLSDALAFADVALTILLNDVGRAESGGSVAWLEDSVTPPQLYQAQGMVMVQVGLRPTDALARIRAYAYAHERRLGDVARDITARRIRFTQDQT